MTELIRWHTPPPNLPRYEENIQIKLNAPYHLANPALRTRLDEFVGFLESKDFRPLETFTELTYRYRDLYGEKPPAGLTYAALFVRVATVEELRAAVSVGWTWDKKTLTDPGYDCVGNPAKIWTLHHYVDNVQNFRLPERDPMHHYGITRLGTHTEMYACCGQPLSNPGCWMGKEKFKIEPYVMAPSFGALVWDYVVADEWDSIERLWMNPPTRGTMWLYKEKYDAWDQQIRKEKERLKDAIVNAFRAVKNEPSKINPLEHMEPMDRIQFEGLLNLQNRYNAIQCQSSVSSAEFFNLERGKETLETAKLVIKFDLTRTNSMWEEERQETSYVSQRNGPEIQQMLGEYLNYLDEMENLQNLLEINVADELMTLPQFATMVVEPSNRQIREHLNRVITGDIQYDPAILPDLSVNGDLWKRYGAFVDANINVGNIDQYYGPLNLSDMPAAAIQDYLNQFWLLDSLKYSGVATDADRAHLQAAQQILEKRPEYVKFMTIKQEGANIVSVNPANDNARRIYIEMGAAKTIQEARNILTRLQEEVQYQVPAKFLDTAKEWSVKYGLKDEFETLQNSTSEAEAKKIYNGMRNKVMVLWLNEFVFAIKQEPYQEAYADLLKRLKTSKLTEETLRQFGAEYRRIKDNLGFMGDLQDMLPALSKEFPNSPDDLKELQLIILNALDPRDARDQFFLKVEQMRANKEDVWVFDAYNLVETSEQNIAEILEPFIQQTKEAKYSSWGQLRDFAKRLKESEFSNIVRIFKGKGAKSCIDSFKDVLKEIQNRPKSSVEEYLGSDRLALYSCLEDLAKRWKYLAVVGNLDNVSVQSLKDYLNGKQRSMREVYDFFKGISDSAMQSCEKQLKALLGALEGKPESEIVRLSFLTNEDAQALLKCMPSGYDQVIEVLEMEPVNVNEFGDVLALLSGEESNNAEDLLNEIDALDYRQEAFLRLVNDPTSSESDFQDFVAQVKLERPLENYTQTWKTLHGAEEEEEEEGDI